MHFADGRIPAEYRRHLARRALMVALAVASLAAVMVTALSVGAASVPPGDVLRALLGGEAPAPAATIVRDIRLPQALAAMLAGLGLALAGTVMQSVLRNPLGSPLTLGVSHAAAFGAAAAILAAGAGAAVISLAAFACSAAASLVIVGVSRTRGANPEVMVLAGVALGSLFTAATMVLQFFADDMQLASMVFWTFGDTARASWRELGLLAAVVLAGAAWFGANAWTYNALDAGDETALSLGVRVPWQRLAGMMVASLMTAVTIAILGVIGFVGLAAPHMARRLVGADHRFLLPLSALLGALLLLAADTLARTVLLPRVLPVSVLTAFLGAPLFLYLILRRRAS